MTVEEIRPADRVVLRHYPKTIFFYPLGILSIILGIIETLFVKAADRPEAAALFASLWLTIFAFNFLVISFEFSIGKTAGIVMAIVLFYVLAILFWGDQFDFSLTFPVGSVDPDFYIWCGIIILLILGISVVMAYFNYWEIRPTEIYLHGGLFEDSQRFGNAQHAHIYKETPDIFERLLFRSGTIVIIPDGSKTVYRLENVYNASGKEKRIREVLSYVPDKPSGEKR